MTASYEMMVTVDETIGFVRRLMQGIDLSPEQLALDAIDKVGPGGSYMNAKHTMQNYRQVWYPRVLDRHNYSGWMKAGQPTANKNAHEIARDAIANHKPAPIAPATLETLNEIIAEADKRLAIQSEA
jgi:trimethylamine--corrinoid protein Co-methyltransferase